MKTECAADQLEVHFARYPAPGLTWYPPFLAFIESLVFAVIGISVNSARFTILLSGTAGQTAYYIRIRQIRGR